MKISELKELEAKATQGKWEHRYYRHRSWIDIDDGGWEVTGMNNEDAALIIALRNAAPDIIKVLEAGEEIISEYKDKALLIPNSMAEEILNLKSAMEKFK